MAPEPEAIRQQINQTRASMAEKLSTLEEKVVDTVKDTTDAVADTVETVKDSVVGTVETVKETVAETVDTVKHTLDLRRQFDRHPWLMLTGSCLTGFLAGKLLGSVGGRPARKARTLEPLAPAAPARTFANGPSGNGARRHDGGSPGLLRNLAAPLKEELGKFKELALGYLFSSLRDLARRKLPEQLAPKAAELLDDLTMRLGGQPLPEKVSPTPAVAAAGEQEDVPVLSAHRESRYG